MRIKRIAAAALALGLLAGCSAGRGIYANYRPIEDLLLVETLGVDFVEAGALGLAAAVEKGTEGARAVEARATGLVQGLAALQDRAGGGRVFFSHCQSFVLGEDYARRRLEGLFDYVERDIHTRMGTHLYVVRGSAAAPLVAGAADVTALLAAVRSETGERGDSHVFDVRQTAVALSEQGAALICALRLVQGEEGGLSAVPAGYGILVGGRLVAYLDGGEARAASLLLGVLGSAALEAALPGGGTATLTVRCGRPDVDCRRGPEGALALEIHAAPVIELAAAEGGADLTDPAAVAALTSAVNERLRADLEAVLMRAKAMDADFLGLGRALRRAGVDPAALPPDWLGALDITVTVEAALTRSDGMGAPLGMAGGGA